MSKAQIGASHDLNWTIAYRKRSANRFIRPALAPTSWADAEALGRHIAGLRPDLQVYTTPSRAYDLAHPDSEDFCNILVDSGKRIRIVDTDTTEQWLSVAYAAVPAAPSTPPAPAYALHGVRTVIEATLDNGTPDGETFTVAEVPSGDLAAVESYVAMALANPIWFNVTVYEHMPLSISCDHPECDHPAPYIGLRHEANADSERNTVPHLRWVNVCDLHTHFWGLWGYNDKPTPIDNSCTNPFAPCDGQFSTTPDGPLAGLIECSDCGYTPNGADYMGVKLSPPLASDDDPELLDALNNHGQPSVTDEFATFWTAKPRPGMLVILTDDLSGEVTNVGSRWLRGTDFKGRPFKIDRNLATFIGDQLGS